MNKLGQPKKEHLAKRRSIRLTDANFAKYKLLGGAKWLRVLIELAK